MSLLPHSQASSCTILVMHDSINPYAPPKHDDSGPVERPTDGATAHYEAIRRAHINAETNIKTLGILLFIGAGGLAITGFATLVSTDVLYGMLSIILGGALGLSAYWLRRLDRRGRWIYSGLVALGVINVLMDASPAQFSFQLGRLFWPILFLAVIWANKASTVMTPHYRDVVIPATPHVKRKTSVVLIVLLVVLVLVLIAVAVAG
jgi:hypothetical protein